MPVPFSTNTHNHCQMLTECIVECCTQLCVVANPLDQHQQVVATRDKQAQEGEGQGL